METNPSLENLNTLCNNLINIYNRNKKLIYKEIKYNEQLKNNIENIKVQIYNLENIEKQNENVGNSKTKKNKLLNDESYSKKNISNLQSEKIKFYYFSFEKESYLSSLKEFFGKNNPIEINENNSFMISIEDGDLQGLAPLHETNKFIYATFVIYITTPKIDYNYYCPKIKQLEERFKNNLILIILYSGKYSQESKFENFKGIQINFKVIKDEIYDDDSNKISLKKICRSIKNKSLEDLL